MNFEIMLLVGLYLFIMMLLDIKNKKIPSIIPTTIILFLIVTIGLRSYPSFQPDLYFGIMGFVLAWLLYEFDYFRGIADIKAIVIISLTLASLNQFYTFVTLLIFIGLMYQVVLIQVFKYKQGKEIPFMPVFFIVYVCLQLLIYVF